MSPNSRKPRKNKRMKWWVILVLCILLYKPLKFFIELCFISVVYEFPWFLGALIISMILTIHGK